MQAGDFNGDGKPDLLVGAFGWRSTGFIGLLANRTESYAQPSFETARLDERTGTIHVVPTDLNKDGRLDFVALISQQHETVVAYLNNGAGFAQETLYTAPHPNWGSSGMQLVDFDRDGDLDVLVTNGDSFDDFLLKPYHGIQWLENEGRYPYTSPVWPPSRARTARWRSISTGRGSGRRGIGDGRACQGRRRTHPAVSRMAGTRSARRPSRGTRWKSDRPATPASMPPTTTATATSTSP